MYVHGHALFICQLPNCNLFTQHAVYLMGETPLVNCGPRSNSLYWNTIYCNTVLLFSANNHLPHNTVNPLLQQAGEIDNLTVSLGQSTLVVLCRFHVGAGIPGVAPHYTSPPSTCTCFLTPTGSINLGFLLRETCCCAHHTFLLGFSTDVSTTRIKQISGAVAGEIKTRCKGSLHFQSLYFVFVLLYFIYYFVCCT